MYHWNVEWLKRYVPVEFWNMFNNHFLDLNIQHRDFIANFNRSRDLSEDKSLLKLMSYNGAVAITSDFEHIGAHWVDESGRYFDPSNYFYARVFRACWPGAFEYYADVSIGDRVEAFLGYHWRARRRGVHPSEFRESFVQYLEGALLAAVTLYSSYSIEV